MEAYLSLTNPALLATPPYRNPAQITAAVQAHLMFAVRAAPDLASACCTICERVDCEHQRRTLCSLVGAAWDDLHTGGHELRDALGGLMYAFGGGA